MEPPPQVSVEAARAWDRPMIVWPSLAVFAAVGGLFDSFTFSANLLVLVVGGGLMWLGLTGRAGRRRAPDRLPRATAWWLIPVLSLSLVELITFSLHDAQRFPTLSLLADPVLESYPARTACYFGWLAAFWGLIRR